MKQKDIQVGEEYAVYELRGGLAKARNARRIRIMAKGIVREGHTYPPGSMFGCRRTAKDGVRGIELDPDTGEVKRDGVEVQATLVRQLWEDFAPSYAESKRMAAEAEERKRANGQAAQRVKRRLEKYGVECNADTSYRPHVTVQFGELVKLADLLEKVLL